MQEFLVGDISYKYLLRCRKQNYQTIIILIRITKNSQYLAKCKYSYPRELGVLILGLIGLARRPKQANDAVHTQRTATLSCTYKTNPLKARPAIWTIRVLNYLVERTRMQLTRRKNRWRTISWVHSSWHKKKEQPSAIIMAQTTDNSVPKFKPEPSTYHLVLQQRNQTPGKVRFQECQVLQLGSHAPSTKS